MQTQSVLYKKTPQKIYTECTSMDASEYVRKSPLVCVCVCVCGTNIAQVKLDLLALNQGTNQKYKIWNMILNNQ